MNQILTKKKVVENFGQIFLTKVLWITAPDSGLQKNSKTHKSAPLHGIL